MARRLAAFTPPQGQQLQLRREWEHGGCCWAGGAPSPGWGMGNPLLPLRALAVASMTQRQLSPPLQSTLSYKLAWPGDTGGPPWRWPLCHRAGSEGSYGPHCLHARYGEAHLHPWWEQLLITPSSTWGQPNASFFFLAEQSHTPFAGASVWSQLQMRGTEDSCRGLLPTAVHLCVAQTGSPQVLGGT